MKKYNLNKIQVGATFHITRKELTISSKEDIQKYVTQRLANELAYHIANKCDILETRKTENGGLQFRANCYVLTPDNFSKLVETIQEDLLRFTPTMIGGINSS